MPADPQTTHDGHTNPPPTPNPPQYPTPTPVREETEDSK